MKTKHTPAPWQHHDLDYCPEEIYGNIDLEDGKLRGTHICTIEDNDEMGANARLIVTSPELLEFAEKQLAWLIHIEPNMVLTHSVKMGIQQGIKAAKKVIAKAKI